MAVMNDAPRLAEFEFAAVADLPAGWSQAAAEDLHTLLDGPTLFHLPGRQERPLFVSILLHGNEATGLHAVQMLLRKYADRPLPRSLSILIGNVEAARAGVRRLDGQPDYNRVWPGTPHPACAETLLMAQVVETMARREVFASVDVHNNTGINPHYACVNRLENRFLQLAAMFGRLVIHFVHPRGTQTAALAAWCPAVTLECGKPGQPYGAEHAFEYLDACLHLTGLPDHPPASHDVDLYHTAVQVLLRDEVSFGFAGEGVDLCLRENLDHWNFTDLPAGAVMGIAAEGLAHLPLRAMDEVGRNVAEEYFAIEDGLLIFRKSVMPSMLTLNEQIIRQDCLCYLMERIAVAADRVVFAI